MTLSRPARPPGHTVRHILDLARTPLHTLPEWFAAHGDILRVDVPGLPTVLVGNPAAIHQVLVVDAASFVKDHYTRSLSDVLGQGLLTSEGAFWKKQRRIVQPSFHGAALRSYADAMVDHGVRQVAAWGPRAEVDMHHELMGLTLRIVAATLFGVAIDDGDAQAIGEALDHYMDAYMGLCGTGLRVPTYLPTPDNRKRRRAIRSLHGVVGGLIERHRDTARDGHSLLSLLLAAADEGMPEEQLLSEALTLLMAGHETTASALTTTLYLLAQHPNVEERLHAEVDGVLGDRRATLDDLSQLPYTAAVVDEAMRLYPPAWAVGREAVCDLDVGGYQVRRGDQLWLATWAVHRDGRFWDAPLAFRPQRWLDGVDVPKGAYLPFALGPRACVGKRFARMEAILVLATLARGVAARLVPGETLDLLPSVTLRPDDGLRMTVTRRQGAAAAAA